MKVTKQELQFWSESLNEVMRGFSVKPSPEYVFGDLVGEIGNIDNLLLDVRKNSGSESDDAILEVANITKKHLQVIKIAMTETVKELGVWELPLRTSSTLSQAQNYIENIEKYLQPIK